MREITAPDYVSQRLAALPPRATAFTAPTWFGLQRHYRPGRQGRRHLQRRGLVDFRQGQQRSPGQHRNQPGQRRQRRRGNRSAGDHPRPRPDAELAFSGAGTSLLFVHAALWLANDAFDGEGADIIVDDLGYYSEPFFEDGLVALAATDAVAGGAVFVSAAGNFSDGHYSERSRTAATATTISTPPARPTSRSGSSPTAISFSNGTTSSGPRQTITIFSSVRPASSRSSSISRTTFAGGARVSKSRAAMTIPWKY